MKFDRKTVFDGLRPTLNMKFNDRQVTSVAAILDEFERRKLPDLRWLAYMLATVWHECRFEPVREIGRGKGRKYGKPHPDTGKVYYGRGFVQLTWYDNYVKMGETLKLPLTTDPDMVLLVPVATAILFEGMTTGVTTKDSFTAYQLHEFFNDKVNDPVGARKIINGTDKAKLIAGYHNGILAVLMQAKRDDVVAAKPVAPPVADVPAPVPAPAPAPKPAPDLPRLDLPDTAESTGTSILLTLVIIAAVIGLGLLVVAAQFIGE